MYSLNECKKFVSLHAKTLNLGKDFTHSLSLITTLSDDSPDGWARVFSEEAERQLKKNKIDKALGYLNIARFPYANTPIQKEAYQCYLSLFRKEYVETGFLEAKKAGNGKSSFYYKKGKSKVTVIICGGIISLKEQWIRALKTFNKLGCSVVLYEMPGVGENGEAYDNKSLNLFSHVIDSIDFDDDGICHVVGISFSGYFALKDACTDARIKSITMTGTPLVDFFHDRHSFDRSPEITKDILSYLISKNHYLKDSHTSLYNFLDEYFPRINVVRNDIAIYYSQSKFDEVISANEALELTRSFNDVYLLLLPDEHGSPNFYKVVFMFVLWSLSKTINANWFVPRMLRTGIHLLYVIFLIKNIFPFKHKESPGAEIPSVQRENI
ncbi:alpha/beta hydrolase [Enterobacter asburiae]|uniref:alpha/beta hydrolase n=1 Tax=Enterobacter asburiae TaxID=61645 RepID=UPI0011D245EC|nr:alpha/beta hydrolase [Enterobacter asburiae]